ncbi:hypothetical protein B0H10DRAFT_2376244 [Mycena sp. CBHHK59/15]|nr:hypothetical protein B0H10DRAFT_2376244 [Mycena sp. CBHHK59/15]
MKSYASRSSSMALRAIFRCCLTIMRVRIVSAEDSHAGGTYQDISRKAIQARKERAAGKPPLDWVASFEILRWKLEERVSQLTIPNGLQIVELVVARVLLLNTSGIAVEMGIGHCHQVRACSGLQPRSDVIDLAFVAGQKQKYNRLWDSKPEPVGIDDSTFSCCNQLGQKTTKTRGYPCTQICGYAYPRVFPQINPHWPTGNSHRGSLGLIRAVQSSMSGVQNNNVWDIYWL